MSIAIAAVLKGAIKVVPLDTVLKLIDGGFQLFEQRERAKVHAVMIAERLSKLIEDAGVEEGVVIRLPDSDWRRLEDQTNELVDQLLEKAEGLTDDPGSNIVV